MRYADLNLLGLGVVAFALAGCNRSQQRTADSTAGAVASNVRTELSVIGVDIGKHIDGDKKISDGTDTFMPTDTIFASIHTSPTAKNGALVGRWTFQDGTLVDERTDSVTTSGDGRTVFFIMKPSGLPSGTYTLHVLVDGKEVRTKNATVT